MKKTFIAALALLALASCGNKNENTETATSTSTEPTTEVVKDVPELTTAPEGEYVFVDANYVIAESEIVKTEGAALEEKGKTLEEKGRKLEEKFAKQEQGLQYALQQLNEKYQKGLITTRDAQTEQEKLQNGMVSLQNQAKNEGTAFQKEMGEFQEEMMVFNNRVNDLLLRAVKEFNADGKYKMVVNIASLLDYDKSLDVTSLVLAKANELYAAEKK